jgi:hypothetical protein
VILTSGVTITEYEDGSMVIVNTTSNPWNYYGNTVDVNNYIVLKQGLMRQGE